MLRSRALVVVAAVALASAACGGKSPDTKPTASPSVAPYLTVPSNVQLTPPGTQLPVGKAAVVAWRPKQSVVAALQVKVTRIERTTYDKSFQGWKITSAQAATTPYFVRAVVTNVSGKDLGGTPVPLWGLDDAGRLVGPQAFGTRTFEPCHPSALPKTFPQGAHADVCAVFAISPGHDLVGTAFQPQGDDGSFLQLVTWKGKINTDVKPPAPPKKNKTKKTSSKTGKKGR